MNVSTAAEQFTTGLNAKFAQEAEFAACQFTVTAGRKFDKVCQAQRSGSNLSVHAFVERETGFVYKAATWAKPANGVRFASVDEAVEAADLYGGYLYAR